VQIATLKLKQPNGSHYSLDWTTVLLRNSVGE